MLIQLRIPINLNTKIKPSFVISVREDFREKSRLRDRAEYKKKMAKYKEEEKISKKTQKKRHARL